MISLVSTGHIFLLNREKTFLKEITVRRKKPFSSHECRLQIVFKWMALESTKQNSGVQRYYIYFDSYCPLFFHLFFSFHFNNRKIEYNFLGIAL